MIKLVLFCVLSSGVLLRSCSTSTDEQYCDAIDGSSSLHELAVAEEGEPDRKLPDSQEPEKKGWAVETWTDYTSYFSPGLAAAQNAVGLVFTAVASPFRKAAAMAMDEATKIAYKVWTVLFDETSGLLSPYRSTIFSVILYVLWLGFIGIFWKFSVPLRWIVFFICSAYLLSIVFGSELILGCLITAVRYFWYLCSTMAGSYYYRVISAVVVVAFSFTFCFIGPLLRKTTRVDRMTNLELRLGSVLLKLNEIEELIVKNQQDILERLEKVN